MMRPLAALSLALAFYLTLPGAAGAVGTPAGTDISNTATATYLAGGVPVVVTSNTETVTVEEVLDVDVTLQSAVPVPVSPGDTSQVLAFLVTNLGNGVETFALAALSVLPADDFDPTLSGVFLDSNGNGAYDPGTDAAYAPGLNDPTLDANTPGADSIHVFVLNDIPVGPSPGDLGLSELAATSTTGSGAPGTVIAGAGDGGTDAVVGASGGDDSDVGSYEIAAAANVSTVKSAAVDDGLGGTRPVPGAVITYTLVVTVSGAATAANVVVTDPIPANTTYSPGSLTLNAAPLTDAADADAGDHGFTNPGEITVSLGDLTSASPPQTITFDVIIN
jgi:uncharacterized repeat protein (TIGR01451 family)